MKDLELKLSTINPKDGDVIILQLPSDEYGYSVGYDEAMNYHKALMELFPNNNVLTIPDMYKVTKMSDEAFNRYVDSMIKMRKGEGLNMISSKILKKEIKIGKVIREDDEYKVLDMDKDGNVISVKSLEDLLEDFVDLEGVNIKVEFINKVDR